jgi:hypothetical protein
MSWADIAYVKKLKVTPDGTPISKSEKLLLFVLADYCNEDGSEAWVSLPRLAEESLQTPAEVVRILQGLDRKKVLEINRDPDAPRTRPAHPRRTHHGAYSCMDRHEIGRPGAIVAETAEPDCR